MEQTLIVYWKKDRSKKVLGSTYQRLHRWKPQKICN